MLRCFSQVSAVLLGLGCAMCLASEETGRTAREVSQEAAERVSPVEVPKVPLTVDPEQAEAMQKLADEARRRGQVEFQRLEGKNSGQQESHDTNAPLVAGEASSGRNSAHPVAGRLIVALSSSMPMSMVQAYMAQLAGVPEAIVVLRGFVGGAHTVAPTGKWVEEARRVQPSCLRCEHYNVQVVVDPLVYRALNIGTQVPAVAFAPGVTDISHCDGNSLHVGAIVYGAVSIESALGSLEKSGVVIPTELKERVRSKGWESQLKRRIG